MSEVHKQPMFSVDAVMNMLVHLYTPSTAELIGELIEKFNLDNPWSSVPEEQLDAVEEFIDNFIVLTRVQITDRKILRMSTARKDLVGMGNELAEMHWELESDASPRYDEQFAIDNELMVNCMAGCESNPNIPMDKATLTDGLLIATTVPNIVLIHKIITHAMEDIKRGYK